MVSKTLETETFRFSLYHTSNEYIFYCSLKLNQEPINHFDELSALNYF